MLEEGWGTQEYYERGGGQSAEKKRVSRLRRSPYHRDARGEVVSSSGKLYCGTLWKEGAVSVSKSAAS